MYSIKCLVSVFEWCAMFELVMSLLFLLMINITLELRFYESKKNMSGCQKNIWLIKENELCVGNIVEYFLEINSVNAGVGLTVVVGVGPRADHRRDD